MVSTSTRPRRRCTGRAVGFESRPVSFEVTGLASPLTAPYLRERCFGSRTTASAPPSTRCFRRSGGFESCPIRSTPLRPHLCAHTSAPTGRCQIYNVSAGQVTFRVSGRSTSFVASFKPQELSSCTAVSYDPGFRESVRRCTRAARFLGTESPARPALLVRGRTFCSLTTNTPAGIGSETTPVSVTTEPGLPITDTDPSADPNGHD